ncbi:MAG: hypothetical protein Wins2KO_05510 [Winogradskyella sp.]
MTKPRIIGLILVATGIILNKLFVGNDFADLIMGFCVGAGIVFLIPGIIKSKTK